MKKGICIIDYIGHSDNNGKPVGHPIKTVNEYTKLLKNDVDISLAIPEIYEEEVELKDITKVIWLKYYTNVTITNLSIKITKTIKKIINIKKVLKNDNNNVIWFINMDFALGIALLLFPRLKKRKIWITNYLNEYTDGSKLSNWIKNFLFYRIMNNVDRIISSSLSESKYSERLVYMPDYYFDYNNYSKYKPEVKKNQIVCLGTMSESKDLETLVNTFNKSGILLKIVGNFYDKNRYENLVKIANENIELNDINLEYEDYYKLIGESKYVILPYKKEFYNLRTSGVLLETIFLESIPIAPKFLLELNDIKGIGFDAFREILGNLKSSENKSEDIISANNNLINSIYNIDSIKGKLISCFKEDTNE
jgi:glycosyltransferase involved in cell wall biosynthesis